jgi:predicted nucleic acid-binding protein
MKQLFDTSVLVAGLVDAHEQHEDALSYLNQVRNGNAEMVISTHALAETYSTLTVLNIRPRITPGRARRIIDEEVLAVAVEVAPLDASDYEAVLARMADLKLVSGAIYDGLHVRAAEKIDADELLTCNGSDFRRMPPADPTRLVVV